METPQSSVIPGSDLTPLRGGQTGGARWRGARQSDAFLGWMETAIADISALLRRGRLSDPWSAPSLNPLAPAVYQVHMTNLQAICAQVSAKLRA